MRTRKLTKFTILILIAYIFSISAVLAYNESTAVPASFFNIEEVTYSPVITNTSNNFAVGSEKTVKAIKLGEFTNDTTWDESFHAIPHINVENYTATLSNSNNDSSICRLVAKVSVDYDSIGNYDAWFEIDTVKTYIYRRTYLNRTADDFTVTLYYVIDDSTVLTNNPNQYLSLDTGGATNFYMFYLLGNDEVIYYTGTLTSSIVTPTTPDFNPTPDTFLNINAQRPSGWTQTSFFDDLGTDHLAWIVTMQTGYTTNPAPSSNQEYKIALKIDSVNDFKLISTDAGNGVKEIPYTLKLSKNNSGGSKITVSETDTIKIINIKNNSPRFFNIYAKSTFSNTSSLNSGRFSDTIYLNFITDLDSISTNKTIKALPF